MANKFQITISAVDQATKVVRGIKNSFSGIVRPISNIKKSVSNLGKETGISNMIGRFAKLGTSGAEVGSKLGVMAGPMAAIGGATSIAGIAALASEWGRLGIEVTNAAANIGISTERLSTMQGIAKLAGTSSEGLTKGLKSLGDTMQDALSGRNQQALVLMSRLGVGIHRTADGAVDAERAFSDLADAIARQSNPQTQSLIARQFGLEDQLPLLRKGSAGIAEYKRQVRELSGVTEEQIQSAAKFGQAQGKLNVAIGGIGNVIQQRLIPRFQPVIEGLTNWIAKHREAAANVTELGVSLAIVAGIAGLVAIPFGVVGGVIAGVAVAAVAAVAMIYTHWSGIAGFFTDKFNAVKAAFDKGFVHGIMEAIKQFNPILLLGDIMNGLVKWLFDFDLFAAGGRVIQSLIAGMKSVVPAGLAHTLGLDVSGANVPAAAPTAALPSTMQQSSAAAAAAPQKVHVEIDAKNMPQGMQVKAKSGMGNYLPTRVNYSMPTMVAG
jgi:hypothetical protein